jgi:hypothetical protein
MPSRAAKNKAGLSVEQQEFGMAGHSLNKPQDLAKFRHMMSPNSRIHSYISNDEGFVESQRQKLGFLLKG